MAAAVAVEMFFFWCYSRINVGANASIKIK
jgi:hypothetical protein